MTRIDKIIQRMETRPQSVRFDEAVQVCRAFFGTPRQASGSHVIFKTPWPGDPRINLQNKDGKAKVHQIRQILMAIERLKAHQEQPT